MCILLLSQFIYKTQQTTTKTMVQTSDISKSVSKKQRLVNRAPAESCWMIDVSDDFKIETLKDMVRNCRVLARFSLLGKIYFTGEVREEFEEDLRTKHKIIETEFGADIRSSKVLVLSMRDSRKERKPLTLQGAVDIVMSSALSEWSDDIELIGIQSQRSKKVHHIYVQLSTLELAQSLVHVVDAMPYGSHFIHSPQVDDHPDFYGGRKGRSSVWINSTFKPLPDLLDDFSDVEDDFTGSESGISSSCNTSSCCNSSCSC